MSLRMDAGLWQRTQDQDGREYWYNTKTMETSV